MSTPNWDFSPSAVRANFTFGLPANDWRVVLDSQLSDAQLAHAAQLVATCPPDYATGASDADGDHPGYGWYDATCTDIMRKAGERAGLDVLALEFAAV